MGNGGSEGQGLALLRRQLWLTSPLGFHRAPAAGA